MSKEALKLALEALEMFCEHGAILRPIETRDAIREALNTPAGNWRGSTIEELDKMMNSSLSRIGLCFELERLLWERNR